MTVSTYSPVSYVADGLTTDFIFNWNLWDENDICVTIVRGEEYDEQDINYDYTVVSGTSTGGWVVFNAAPDDGIVLIESNVPYTQGSDYQENGLILASTIEQDFDKSALRDAQLNKMYDRTLKVPRTESSVAEVPPISVRGNRIFMWDEGGNPTVSTVTEEQLATLVPSSGTATSYTVVGTVSGTASINLYADNGDDISKKWRTVAKDAGSFAIQSFATGDWVDAFEIDTVNSGTYNIITMEHNINTLTDKTTDLSTLDTAAYLKLSGIEAGATLGAIWGSTIAGIPADIYYKATDTLDDIDDGSEYKKLLATSIAAGRVVLSEATGTLDDIENGTTWGKIAITDIQLGHILLGETVGDLDDVADGTTYGKTNLLILDSGYITLFGQDGGDDGYMTATSSGIQGYVNDTKYLDLNTSGYLYLGDQANEHIKLSSAGMEYYDGATRYAQYGASTTIGRTTTGYGNILITSAGIYLRSGTTTKLSITDDGISGSTNSFVMAYKNATSSNQTGDGTWVTLVCNTEIKDIEGDYVAATGVYTARATGLHFYHIAAMLQTSGTPDIHDIRLIHKNSAGTILNTYYGSYINTEGGGHIQTMTGKLDVVVYMTAGDYAYAQVMSDGASKAVDIYGGEEIRTYFNCGIQNLA